MENKRKIPPKVKALMRDPQLSAATDSMLQNGVSYKKIREYLDSKGFSISVSYLTKYKQLQTMLQAEENNLEKFLNGATIADMVKNAENKALLTAKGKLKRDMDYIDIVIQEGARQLKERLKSGDVEISIRDVFDAIKLKESISDGAYDGYTDYGIEHMQRMSEEKYMMLIRSLFMRLPEIDRAEALRDLENLEEAFYRETDYYEEYLRSLGKSDKEIGEKLNG